ncbi:MAG: GyrI-like domain-containing protein [Myxococcaceae bacterium]|nr:GyrI-like domain-containing protein [Myxococcaceae bacterium]
MSRAKTKQPTLPMPEVLFEAPRTPDVVTVPARKVLSIEGAGSPDGDAFAQAIGALYGVAYTLKFARKFDGGTGFQIGPLEGRWWAKAGSPFPPPRDAWQWRLRIAVPSDVTAAELKRTITAATTKKGGKLEGSVAARRVELEKVPRQQLGRALHVGPYADEPETFAKIDGLLREEGLRPGRSHLEVYLSDPRRTKPAKLKTVLLRELR